MADEQSAAVADEEPAVETAPREDTRKKKKPKRQPRYHVILWDDDDHTLRLRDPDAAEAVRPSARKGLSNGRRRSTPTARPIVLTTTREHAELKRDQIHAYGKDDADRQLQGLDVGHDRTVGVSRRGRLDGRGMTLSRHHRTSRHLTHATSLPASTRPSILASATLRTVTLGCKVNQYETEFVRQGARRHRLSRCRARRSGRSVHRQHLHGHGRRRLQEPADDSPTGGAAIPARGSS